MTPHDFVYDLYQAFLRYAPDQAGWDYWTTQVGTSWQNKQSVMNAFITAGPYAQTAGTLYREVLWLTPDHLGTPRLIAERTGSFAGMKRHDYLPFGEELFAGQGGRSQTQGYSVGDSVRQKFTSKERDNETGLDYFDARYYSSTQGRFQSPDPLLNSGRPANPKSWNRYAYGFDNPARNVDPNGLYNLDANCANDKTCKQSAERLKKGIENLTKAVNKMKDSDEKVRLQHSLTALGTENDKNKVNVVFGALSGTAAAQTDFKSEDDGSYKSFTITFDMSKGGNASSVGMVINAAHEGTHISDFDDVLGRSQKTETALDPFQSEYRGYLTSAWAAQALGEPSLSFNGHQIWNASWAEADRRTLMDKGITDHVKSIPDHGENPIHDPWPDRFSVPPPSVFPMRD